MLKNKDAVAVIGVGCSRYGDRIDASLTDLFVEAYLEAINDIEKGIDPSEIEEAFIGSYSFGGDQIGNVSSLMIDYAGIPMIPAGRIENACGSGGYAFRYAILSILSGVNDIALVGGVEKMRDIPGTRARLWLGGGGDTQWERWHGLTFPGVFALQATRHMHEYGTTREQLAMVAVKNHANAAKNPKAHFQRETTVENILESPMLSYPLTLFDCCPTTDGAAVAIVCRADIAKKYSDTPIYVSGFGATVDRLAICDRLDITKFPAAIQASREAYKMAGVEPKDIDLVELHDCFTIAEIVLTEDLGFCKKGEGGKFVEEGQSQIGGEVAINSSGGLKAKGHPLGATGVGQIYDITKQLRNEAEKRSRQVPDAEIGMAQIQGGFGVSAAAHILRR
jgi:acetyl-CoA C-acetyltransferase/acetyl-CoA acyltransferase